MRLKTLAIALLAAGSMVVPAFAPAVFAQPVTAPAARTTTPPPVLTTRPTGSTTATVPAAGSPAVPPAAPTTTARPVTATPALAAMAPMNINTASAVDLDKLPQIGKVRAQKIITNRPYKTIDELVTKKAISQGVFEKIKDRITVG